MRNLFQFLWKYNVFILFLILEIIAFTLIINNTNYQRAVIISSSNKITGLSTELRASFNCKALILTAGTFLNGKLYIGSDTAAGGRVGEPASEFLSE